MTAALQDDQAFGAQHTVQAHRAKQRREEEAARVREIAAAEERKQRKRKKGRGSDKRRRRHTRQQPAKSHMEGIRPPPSGFLQPPGADLHRTHQHEVFGTQAPVYEGGPLRPRMSPPHEQRGESEVQASARGEPAGRSQQPTPPNLGVARNSSTVATGPITFTHSTSHDWGDLQKQPKPPANGPPRGPYGGVGGGLSLPARGGQQQQAQAGGSGLAPELELYEWLATAYQPENPPDEDKVFRDVYEFMQAHPDLDINGPFPPYSQTLLMRAARGGYADVATLFILQGATVDAQDSSGMTALMHASAAGYSRTIEVSCGCVSLVYHAHHCWLSGIAQVWS